MRTLTVFFCLVFLSVGTAVAQPVTLKQFDVTPTETGAVVKVESSQPEASDASVRIPVEGLVFQSQSRDKVTESDLFDSGLSVDVNGDGDTQDVILLSRKDGQDYVGDLPVRPFAESMERQSTGQGKVYQINESSPKFIVYQTRPELMVGLEYQGSEAGFIEMPSPTLQFMVIEECEGPDGSPGVELQGARRVLYAFEPGFESPEHAWHRIQWMTLEAGKEHQLTLKGKGKGFLVCFVNWAPEPGVRQRTILHGMPIEL
jgi:hypothetical protein